jgi:hypothetical protein
MENASLPSGGAMKIMTVEKEGLMKKDVLPKHARTMNSHVQMANAFPPGGVVMGMMTVVTRRMKRMRHV